MTTPTAASLLHLIDRAERGSLLAEEAQQLRNGIRALGVRDQEMEQLRAEVDRQVQAKVDIAGKWGNALADKAAAEAGLARVQQAACRTAENLRRAEGRVAELEKLHEAHLRVEQRLAREQLAAEAAIERAKTLAERWENGLFTGYPYAEALRGALDQPQQPTTTEA